MLFLSAQELNLNRTSSSEQRNGFHHGSESESLPEGMDRKVGISELRNQRKRRCWTDSNLGLRPDLVLSKRLGLLANPEFPRSILFFCQSPVRNLLEAKKKRFPRRLIVHSDWTPSSGICLYAKNTGFLSSMWEGTLLFPPDLPMFPAGLPRRVFLAK